jgi:hypothetical protein
MRQVVGPTLQTSHHISFGSGPVRAVDFLGVFQEFQSNCFASDNSVLPRLLEPALSLFP